MDLLLELEDGGKERLTSGHQAFESLQSNELVLQPGQEEVGRLLGDPLVARNRVRKHICGLRCKCWNRRPPGKRRESDYMGLFRMKAASCALISLGGILVGRIDGVQALDLSFPLREDMHALTKDLYALCVLADALTESLVCFQSRPHSAFRRVDFTAHFFDHDFRLQRQYKRGEVFRPLDIATVVSRSEGGERRSGR
ncbi:hypothetical protein Naga_100008g92 [Nannochloropsis gaditana]|uniref:Uncharacterized protein n=1 Tax=Nannochloropsis gaditana TaxID=72520 RepID=W7TPJ0_9STRA|nr:hypothetical protein Naga_100008g92 [Nannochloropsis gaditana]